MSQVLLGDCLLRQPEARGALGASSWGSRRRGAARGVGTFQVSLLPARSRQLAQLGLEPRSVSPQKQNPPQYESSTCTYLFPLSPPPRRSTPGPAVLIPHS